MLIEERNTVINDAHRGLLVITSDKRISLQSDYAIVDKRDGLEKTYYTDGLFRSFFENGKYTNWYLINSIVVKVTAEETLKKEVAELKANTLDLTEAFVNKQFEQDTATLGI